MSASKWGSGNGRDPSFPRRRESRAARVGVAMMVQSCPGRWIPACAGMTVGRCFCRQTRQSFNGHLFLLPPVWKVLQTGSISFRTTKHATSWSFARQIRPPNHAQFATACGGPRRERKGGFSRQRRASRPRPAAKKGAGRAHFATSEAMPCKKDRHRPRSTQAAMTQGDTA